MFTAADSGLSDFAISWCALRDYPLIARQGQVTTTAPRGYLKAWTVLCSVFTSHFFSSSLVLIFLDSV